MKAERTASGWKGLTASALMSIAMLTSSVYGRNPNKLSAELTSGSSEATVNVIVQFKDTPNAKQHQKITNRGGKLKTDFGGIIKAAHYEIPAAQLDSLTDDPDVLFVTPDRPVSG